MTHRMCLFAIIVVTTPASAADWPQWMGPKRDDVWAETGIVQQFPPGGPKVLWRKPVHGGFAGPAVAGGRVYVTDYARTEGDDKPAPTRRNQLKGKERVLCLDAKTGAELSHVPTLRLQMRRRACHPSRGAFSKAVGQSFVGLSNPTK